MNPRCSVCGQFMVQKELSYTIETTVLRNKPHRRMGRDKRYVCPVCKRSFKAGKDVIHE